MKFVKDSRQLRKRNEFVGIDQRWIDGLRLTEQTIPLAAIKRYTQRLEYTDANQQIIKETIS